MSGVGFTLLAAEEPHSMVKCERCTFVIVSEIANIGSHGILPRWLKSG